MSRKVVLVIAVILTIFMGIHFFFKRSSVQNRIGDVEYGVYNSDIQTAYTSAPTLPETLTTATFTIHNTSMITTSSTATALDLGRWTSVQEQRHARMLRGCEHLNLKNGTLTQQGTPASHILVNDKYKLMYCFIPKVRCTSSRCAAKFRQNKTHNQESMVTIGLLTPTLLDYMVGVNLKMQPF